MTKFYLCYYHCYESELCFTWFSFFCFVWLFSRHVFVTVSTQFIAAWNLSQRINYAEHLDEMYGIFQLLRKDMCLVILPWNWYYGVIHKCCVFPAVDCCLPGSRCPFMLRNWHLVQIVFYLCWLFRPYMDVCSQKCVVFLVSSCRSGSMLPSERVAKFSCRFNHTFAQILSCKPLHSEHLAISENYIMDSLFKSWLHVHSRPLLIRDALWIPNLCCLLKHVSSAKTLKTNDRWI